MLFRAHAMLAAALAVLSGPTAARAHHPVAETFSGHAQPATLAGADVEFAGFDLAGTSGHYLTLAARGDYALAPWFAFGARVPFHHLWLADSSSRSGLGDIDLVLKLRLFAGDSLVLSAGLGSEVPTGNPDDGLGSGHVELTPFLSGMAHLGAWMVHGTVADSVSLERGQTHEHVNFIAPHSSHELRYHLGLAHTLGDQLFANVVVSGATILESDDRGTTLLVVAPQLGWTPAASWRLLASVELPITSDKRFDWKTIAAAQYMF